MGSGCLVRYRGLLFLAEQELNTIVKEVEFKQHEYDTMKDNEDEESEDAEWSGGPADI